MTVSAQTVVSVAALAGSTLAATFAYLSHRKHSKNSAKLDFIRAEINGRMTKLIELARQGAFAEGRIVEHEVSSIAASVAALRGHRRRSDPPPPATPLIGEETKC
jgi:hypothetical protein